MFRCFKASAEGITVPLTVTSPSPIKAKLMCESGARSPLAPTDPFAGMQGTIPAFKHLISDSITTGRTPENPRAKLAAFKSMTIRTIASSNSGPEPAQ